MIRKWNTLLEQHREPLYLLFRHLRSLERPILLWSDISHEYETFAESPRRRSPGGVRAPELLHLTRSCW